jgi:putative transposase
MQDARHRHLPHLPAFADTPLVFFTVVTAGRRSLLDNGVVHGVLKDIWRQSGERNGWWVGDYIIMPDHVHFFARQGRTAERMRDWLKLWKSLSSRKIASALGVDPPIWQEEYFDRFLRSSESYTEKWRYVEANAIKERLVSRPEDWPYRGRIHYLQF